MNPTFTLTELPSSGLAEIPSVIPNSLQMGTNFKPVLESKTFESVKGFLRCNPNFDGYVFVPKGNGKVKTGAYITENELANRRLINDPSMVIYYQKSSDKFFTLADTAPVVAKETVSEEPNNEVAA